MGVRKLSAASIKTNNKSTKFADGATGTFELISRTTFNSLAMAVEWDNIPQTYTDLQIRIMAQGYYASETNGPLPMYFNGNVGANYTRHDLYGAYGYTTALAGAYTGNGYMNLQRLNFNVAGNNFFSPIIVDIFDYTSTNKYKAYKGIGGLRTDSAAFIIWNSGLYTANTNAITKIKIDNSNNGFNPNSTLALYGIRSA